MHQPSRPIKLIAIDIDGTLLNRNKQITQRTWEAIQAAHAADFIKRAVDQMLVRNRANGFIGEDASEFAPPGRRKIRVRAAAGSEDESAVA